MCPSNDEIVAGINLTQLFSYPSEAELDSVRARFEADRRIPRHIALIHREEIGGREKVWIARVDVGDEGEQFLVAVREPAYQLYTNHVPRPVFVFLDEGHEVDVGHELATLPVGSAQVEDMFTAFVTNRGGELSIAGKTFTSSGGDIETSIKTRSNDTSVIRELMNMIRFETYSLHVSGVEVVGHGWGGTAALMATLNSSTGNQCSASFAAPTSLLLASVRNDVRSYLIGGPVVSLPDLKEVLSGTVEPLRRGEISLQEARYRLLEDSPAWFGYRAPILVAHGERDEIVRSNHATEIKRAILEARGDVVISPLDDHNSILSNDSVIARVTECMCTETTLKNAPSCVSR